MAEKNAVDLPKNLPSPTKAVNDFVDFMAKPLKILEGLSMNDILGWTHHDDATVERFSLLELDIGDQVMFKEYIAPITTKAWMTGSRVWYPALLDKPCPEMRDIDILFLEGGAALDFLGKAAKLLHNHLGKPNVFNIVENNSGGHKLVHRKAGHALFDAGDLPHGLTIEEYIMGFKWDHERVAMALGAKRDEVHALTRIVRPLEHPELAAKRRQIVAAKTVPVYDDWGS